MFDQLKPLPSDPILGLIALHAEDSNPDKIDLGVGVFRTREGRTPILNCVKSAEASLLEMEKTKAYIGPAGNAGFNTNILKLSLGEEHPVIKAGRVTALQTPGGCGALRVAAELILRVKPKPRIWVSDPTWANHMPLLGDAGIELLRYPYYDGGNHIIRFDELMSTLAKAEADDFVLFHACCHNPCGADFTREQWQSLAGLAEERGFTPFVDMAYQGFAEGLSEDAYGLRLLAERLPEVLFAVSCSKNFGLYRERVGAVGLILPDAAQASTVSSHLKSIVRGIYSMPPSHGAAIVEHILSDPEQSSAWETELAEMRNRISVMRRSLVMSCNALGAAGRFDFIEKERGMFSFLGINESQVQRMAAEHSIYMVDSGRINVAGLNEENLQRFSEALLAVVE